MFKSQNFCHIASNNRNQVKVGVFVYRTTDDLATVLTSGYFNDRIIDINLHDLIIHEKIDTADATKVQRNLLCVTERSLENVGTTLVKSQWEEDIESVVESIQDDIETIQDDIETIQGDITDIKAKDIEQDGRLDDIESGVAYKATDFKTPITNTNKGITETEETALNDKIDLAANSGRMITDQGVWYAKMYAATVAPSAENGTNYADFSQTDGQGNPVIVLYERQNGAWVQTQTIVPPADYDGYVPITSKIWDIVEQAGQQGGRILWNHQSKDFTPYPQIISFENAALTGVSTAPTPTNDSPNNQIVNKEYVDNKASQQGYHPDLFDVKWADHICNDVQWLRADTFSWQSGAVYQVAYAHLVLDIDGKTLQSETISGTTIQFYLADDGHKICPASEESNVTAIYNATGVAWYYIIDTTNQRFKLPRTKFGFTGIRSGVGNYVEAGVPNITGGFTTDPNGGVISGTAFYSGGTSDTNGYGTAILGLRAIYLDASRSSSVYGNSDTVQPKATEMYLYFYVGNFTQTALENTAGVTTETLNRKADLDLANVLANIDFVVESQLPTAENGYTWYRKYKSGWVEQGGVSTTANDTFVTINLPITMANTNYVALKTCITNNNMTLGNISFRTFAVTAKTTTSFQTFANQYSTDGFNWQVSGMAA